MMFDLTYWFLLCGRNAPKTTPWKTHMRANKLPDMKGGLQLCITPEPRAMAASSWLPFFPGFFLPTNGDFGLLPWATFSEPEISTVWWDKHTPKVLLQILSKKPYYMLVCIGPSLFHGMSQFGRSMFSSLLRVEWARAKKTGIDDIRLIQ